MKPETIKFLIIGDLHGEMPIIHTNDFQFIIAPGDFCSDEAKPLMFQSLKLNLDDPKDKTTWFDICGKKEAKKMIQKSLKDGRKILEFLNSLNVPIYITPGNWD
jgi:Icc-related predicted phosphoesterase